MVIWPRLLVTWLLVRIPATHETHSSLGYLTDHVWWYLFLFSKYLTTGCPTWLELAATPESFAICRSPLYDPRDRQSFEHVPDRQTLPAVTRKGLVAPATGGFKPGPRMDTSPELVYPMSWTKHADL